MSLTAPTLPCPHCGVPLGDLHEVLGGFYQGRCLHHGRQTVRGEPRPMAVPEPAPQPLRDEGLARATDPETSKAAAESIDPRGQQQQLMRALLRIGIGCRYELARESGLTEYQAGRRLSELQQAGLIYWTGQVRPGETGRSQSVWAATEAGERWLLGPEGIA